jgi:hypothetical protein
MALQVTAGGHNFPNFQRRRSYLASVSTGREGGARERGGETLGSGGATAARQGELEGRLCPAPAGEERRVSGRRLHGCPSLDTARGGNRRREAGGSGASSGRPPRPRCFERVVVAGRKPEMAQQRNMRLR